MFAAVAECGSFTKAAERLYVSHSSTSRAVSALEAELGVKLLERGNKVIGLTEAGEAVLGKARQIIDLADELATVGNGLDRSEREN